MSLASVRSFLASARVEFADLPKTDPINEVISSVGNFMSLFPSKSDHFVVTFPSRTEIRKKAYEVITDMRTLARVNNILNTNLPKLTKDLESFEKVPLPDPQLDALGFKKDEDGNTGLHVASRIGRSDIAETRKDSFNFFFQNNKGKSAVHIMAEEGHARFFKKAFSADFKLRLVIILQKDKFSRTPFHLACLNGHLEMVQALFEFCKGYARYTIMKHQDAFGETPLHYAAYHGYLDIISFLLSQHFTDQKKFIEMKNQQGKSAFYLACERGNLAAAKLLFQSSDHPNCLFSEDHEGDIPLHAAVLRKQTNIIDFLFRDPRARLQQLKHKNKKGESCLHLAANSGYEEALRALLKDLTPEEKKEAVYIRNAEGDTPLHVAITEQTNEGVRLLQLETDTDKLEQSLKKNEEETSVVLQAFLEDNESIRHLILCSAKEKLKRQLKSADSVGVSVMHLFLEFTSVSFYKEIARRFTYQELEELFSTQDEDGFTALHAGASNLQLFPILRYEFPHLAERGNSLYTQSPLEIYIHELEERLKKRGVSSTCKSESRKDHYDPGNDGPSPFALLLRN